MKNIVKDIVKGNSVILFSTPHCKPCKNMKKILEGLENSHSGKANFYNIDVEKQAELAAIYNIKSVPTTVFKKESEVKDRFAGFIDDVDLENKLMNLLFDFGDEDFL